MDETVKSSGQRNIFWLLACFTCSGMSGLIYEVAWVRSLELIFGATTFAVATVLAAFMGGLASGSYFMGRFGRRWARHHPLMIYAVIECLIAAIAILIPLLLDSLVPLYQAVWRATHASFITFSILRFALSALILLVPTFLMGATLPVISDFVGSDAVHGRKRIGMLYTFNTLGAVFGCAAAGLIFFPTIGLARTQGVAVSLNLLAAGGAFLLARRSRNSPPPPADLAKSETQSRDPILAATQVRLSRVQAGLLVGVYSVSGFVAMLYEVAWSRVLVLVLGSSTYAYTIMLATFLLGLSLGAWLATRFLGKMRMPLVTAGLCQLAIALTTYFSIFLVEELPFLYLKSYETVNPSAHGLLGIQFSLAFGLMFLPTLGLGAMFPITIQGLNPSGERAGRVVGWAYALNTLGAIAGSVLAGFCLIPIFGSQKTMLTGVCLNALLGLLALSGMKSRRLLRYRLPLALLLLLFSANAVYTTPRWQAPLLSTGIFRYVRDFIGMSHRQFVETARRITGEILMFDEGLTCTVTVFRTPSYLSLMVNGKPDASTPSDMPNPFPRASTASLHELPTQSLIGQIPLLLAPRREEVLLIGLGSGVTLGSVLTHPVRYVECIELEDAVVRGSRFFEQYNRRPLSDPRTHLVVNDARNHLLVTDRQYDVIISEPSNPWIPGAANLFTKEFFQISKSKLRPQGVFCQWVQLYELKQPHFRSILRTFTEVFPSVHVFRVDRDAIIVGSMEQRPIDVRELQSRLSPGIREDLARIRIRRVEDLLAHYWVGGAELRNAVQSARLNTDDNMLIEFAAPLQVLAGRNDSSSNPARLFHGRSEGAIHHVGLSPDLDAAAFWARAGQAVLDQLHPEMAVIYARQSMQTQRNAAAGATEAKALALIGRDDAARTLFRQLVDEFPAAPDLLLAFSSFHASHADWKAARKLAEQALAARPDDPIARYYLGRSLYYLNDAEGSLAQLQTLEDYLDDLEQYRDLPFYLGSIHWVRHDFQETVNYYRLYLTRDPTHLDARSQLADALYHLGRAPEARAQWEIVAKVASGQATRQLRKAQDAWQKGDATEAASRLEQARELDPWNSDIVLSLAQARSRQGDVNNGIKLLDEYLQWNPDQPLAVGYLSELLAGDHQLERARVLAARYHSLTGEPWQMMSQ